jgi:hypothetical protein
MIGVAFSPERIVKSQLSRWRGMRADIGQLTPPVRRRAVCFMAGSQNSRQFREGAWPGPCPDEACQRGATDARSASQKGDFI